MEDIKNSPSERRVVIDTYQGPDDDMISLVLERPSWRWDNGDEGIVITLMKERTDTSIGVVLDKKSANEFMMDLAYMMGEKDSL